MRRFGTVSALALALALAAAGCTSATTTKRTVTVVNTITNAATASAAAKAPQSVVVVGSSAAGGSALPSAPAVPTATTTSSPTPTTSAAAAIIKVDPLTVDCSALISAADVKKSIGATIGGSNNRVRLGAADRGVTGAIRCLYGSTDAGKTAPVRIRLTQYSSAAAAQAQVGVDNRTAKDAGATVSSPTVNGYPANVQLNAGGVVELAYDSWTLSLAVSDKIATTEKLTTGLPELAGQILTRIVKSS